MKLSKQEACIHDKTMQYIMKKYALVKDSGLTMNEVAIETLLVIVSKQELRLRRLEQINEVVTQKI